jgi:hypothetical protein
MIILLHLSKSAKHTNWNVKLEKFQTTFLKVLSMLMNSTKEQQ